MILIVPGYLSLVWKCQDTARPHSELQILRIMVKPPVLAHSPLNPFFTTVMKLLAFSSPLRTCRNQIMSTGNDKLCRLLYSLKAPFRVG
jgi:hypothetical protein